MNERTQAAPAANTLAARIIYHDLLHVDLDASTAQNAAHLLLSAIKPLAAIDDDADITLPATALQSLLENSVDELHGMRVAMAQARTVAREHMMMPADTGVGGAAVSATQDRAAAGRAGRAASPWNRSAHATSTRAQLSFLAYCKRSKRKPAPKAKAGTRADVPEVRA